MAIVNPDAMSAAGSGFGRLPLVRQLGLFGGLAASIALGFAVVLWSQSPNFSPIFSDLDSKDAQAVVNALTRGGIEVEFAQGSVMVPSKDMHKAKMLLAADGLPRSGSGGGFSSLHEKSGIGTSQYMENKQYTHALEQELAHTIAKFNSVKSARVHIAMPKQSVFVSDKRKPKASVFVDLYSGQALSNDQVSAISHMVAAGIPNLSEKDVSVVDQDGRLLSNSSGADHVSAANRQFAYIRQLEEAHVKQIEDILGPMLGYDRFKAQVSADVDFTKHEETQESYNPTKNSIRSEQIAAENMDADELQDAGIPGALANQPANADAQKAEAETAAKNEAEDGDKTNTKLKATRNYELDKVISHRSEQPWKLERLSVGLAVDHKSGEGEASTPLTENEIKNIENLVKQAVGFNAERGDTISVVNHAFAKPDPIEALPETAMWDQPWFWTTVKQVLGGLFILFLAFGVLKPILKGLAARGSEQKQMMLEGGGQAYAAVGAAPGAAANAVVNTNQAGLPLPGPGDQSSQSMMMAQNMAAEDPQRVAKVVQQWVEQ